MAIDLGLFTSITDDLLPGGTERVNHVSCPSGEDTRRRLYITRTLANPDTIIAYCHNCQQSGHSTSGKWASYRNELHGRGTSFVPAVTVQANFAAPTGMVADIIDWPLHAQAWAYKGKLDSVIVQHYGIQYDVNSDRVFIPRYARKCAKLNLNLQAYQLRNTDNYKNVPKYLTVCSEHDNGFTVMAGDNLSGTSTTKVVVVEDYVSGIAIIEAYLGLESLTVHCIVNYGTKVSLEALHYAAQYDHVLVWLDNDSEHVKEQAETMARTIRLMSSTQVCVESTRTDPKHYAMETIRLEVEKWAWNKDV